MNLKFSGDRVANFQKTLVRNCHCFQWKQRQPKKNFNSYQLTPHLEDHLLQCFCEISW